MGPCDSVVKLSKHSPGAGRAAMISLLFLLVLSPLHAQDIPTRIDEAVTALHGARLFNGAVLVAKGDEIVLRKGYGTAVMEWNIPVTADTRFRIGSVTKQFTAAIVLKLVEQGKIDLQEKLRTYIPDYPSSQADKVTIHQLLNHTSGIPSYTGLPGFMATTTRLPHPPDSMYARIAHLPFDFEPGSKWQYNNSGYYILGDVIEHVTGMTYDKALRHFLLDPLGLNATGYEHNDDVIPQFANGYVRVPGGMRRAAWLDSSVPYAGGSMYSTVDDLWRWTRALHAGQVFDEADSYVKMTTPYMEHYGYGLIIRTQKAGDKDVRVIEHGGGIFGFRAALWYLPEEGYTIVALDNTEGRSNVAADAAFRILHGMNAELPKPSIADEVYRVVEADGIDAAESRYAELKRSEADKWNFGEAELNTLGYLYLQDGRTDIALRVFKLNIDAYPKSFNPYDSYGEALAVAGRKEEAIINYKKALELNPGSGSAKAALERLGVTVEEKKITFTEAQLDRFVGKYALAPTFILDVTREGTQLFAQATGQQRFEIYPASENTFYLKVVDAQITFDLTGDGPSQKITLHQNGRDMPAKRVE